MVNFSIRLDARVDAGGMSEIRIIWCNNKKTEEEVLPGVILFHILGKKIFLGKAIQVCSLRTSRARFGLICRWFEGLRVLLSILAYRSVQPVITLGSAQLLQLSRLRTHVCV